MNFSANSIPKIRTMASKTDIIQKYNQTRNEPEACCQNALCKSENKKYSFKGFKQYGFLTCQDCFTKSSAVLDYIAEGRKVWNKPKTETELKFIKKNLIKEFRKAWSVPDNCCQECRGTFKGYQYSLCAFKKWGELLCMKCSKAQFELAKEDRAEYEKFVDEDGINQIFYYYYYDETNIPTDEQMVRIHPRLVDIYYPNAKNCVGFCGIKYRDGYHLVWYSSGASRTGDENEI